jgi:hypothetical protein
MLPDIPLGLNMADLDYDGRTGERVSDEERLEIFDRLDAAEADDA